MREGRCLSRTETPAGTEEHRPQKPPLLTRTENWRGSQRRRSTRSFGESQLVDVDCMLPAQAALLGSVKVDSSAHPKRHRRHKTYDDPSQVG